jgi:hypothetical protein
MLPIIGIEMGELLYVVMMFGYLHISSSACAVNIKWGNVTCRYCINIDLKEIVMKIGLNWHRTGFSNTFLL